MNDIDEIKRRINDRKKNKNKVLNDYHFSKIYNGMIKCMIVMLTLLSVGAFIKVSPHASVIDDYILNDQYYKNIYNKTISYVQGYFDQGEVSVFKNVNYTHIKENLYTNSTNEVLNFSNGRVVYVGNQPLLEQYVVVLLENNVEVTYGKLTDVFVDNYDILEEGTIIGTYNNEVILIFNEGIKEIDYETFTSKYY